ncbi:MAG: hypothetical protein O7E49_08355 [Gemmatimonadetes bacterium]|nr:hypothetical protein [Gemmatimonadota bacterium]
MERPDPASYSPGVLRRLAIAAQLDREAFFAEHARWRRSYGDRVEAVVLAEGTRRQVDGGRVAPLEVWTFFRHHPDGPFPTRRRRVRATQDPWKRILAEPSLAGRPLTLVSVSIEADRFDDAELVVRRYLMTGKTTSARRLAKGRVIMLEPAQTRGLAVWQPSGIGIEY